MLHKHKKEGVIAIGIALVLGIGVSTFGFVSTNNTAQNQAVLGVSVTSAAVTVKVKGLQTYPTNAVTQNKRVSLNISVFNNSGRVLQIAPGLQMQLVDSNGASHAVTASYIPAKKIIGGPLRASSTWNQVIDFELSASQTPAQFIYQPDASSNVVRIKL